MSYSLDELLQMMVDYKASDLIIKVGSPPVFRINKALVKAEMDILTPDKTKQLAEELLSEEQMDDLKKELEKDAAYALGESARFRANVFYQQNNIAMVLRLIVSKIPKIAELTLPKVLYDIAYVERGLILVTGTTGSGKSTTLAAVIDYMNQNLNKHIITVEHPIEYVHKDKNCIVTQREVGFDTKDFNTALVAAMRQNPDVILIGEMRDAETVDAAISAAETGHLVLSTLHTLNAVQTINRILEFYPQNHHEQLRSQLAEYLIVSISQRLVPKIDNSGVVPAIEIMLQNPIVKKMILENKLDKLKSVIHQGRQEGMQTFDQSLVELYQAGLVSFEEAQTRCSKPSNFPLYLEGHWPDVETGII